MIAAARGALAALLLAPLALASAAEPVVIDMPKARFATGDDPARARPDFDDSAWVEISTLKNYEKQGFPDYDGYSWYRIHVTIPSSLRATVRWPERLRVYLSSIDDVDETFLNGVRIGATGIMPADPRGYATRWNAIREYAVDASSGLIRWDEDNVIAVRVYDGSGGGGFYRDMPRLSMAEIVDGLRLDLGRTRVDYAPASLTAHLQWANDFPIRLAGSLAYDIYDAASDEVLSHHEAPLVVEAHGSAALDVSAPQRAGIEVRFRFTETRTGAVGKATYSVPYLQTPPESPTPDLHGARILGARPGSPIYYRIPATGKGPLAFTAHGLPPGLHLDARTGVIQGRVATAGSYRIGLQVTGPLGHAARVLTLQVRDTLALTPPMGWNSWNAYGLDVNGDKVRAVADALISSGLAAHGWNYINVDDGWEAAERAADGEIRSNAKFPDMAALAADLHARGLRFGIYSSPGPLTCGRFLGSLGHERQDAATYARWGVDYLKYDLCSYEQRLPKQPSVADHQAPYRLMGAALAEQPRDIVFSLCQYGNADVWKWGAEVGGNSWRTTGDIEDSWSVVKEIIDSQYRSAPYARPGHWNDPDMLVVGEVGWGGDLHPSLITPDEQYSHISLWSLLAAPLLLGNELTHLDAFTRNLLTNDEVLAIDQDALGHAAARAWSEDGWEIWVRELEGGRKAIGVFNFGSTFRSLPLAGKVADLAPGVRLRDVWRQRELGALDPSTLARVPAHGVLLLTLRPGGA
jgi:hypothetical protein